MGVPLPTNALRARLSAVVEQLYTPGNAFGLPDFAVRYALMVIIIGGYLWMQWHSPKAGAVPQELIAAAGIVTGYALTGKASPTMKGVVAVAYVVAMVAFLLAYNWVPGEITGQVTLVVGAYFGGKEK